MEEVLAKAYAAFNARNIDEALTTMHTDVAWPNGWEGGWVHGHAGVRDYWIRQWAVINPVVEPLRFTTQEDGRIVVDVRQVVHDLDGAILSERLVQHIYHLEAGRIRRMEIR